MAKLQSEEPKCTTEEIKVYPNRSTEPCKQKPNRRGTIVWIQIHTPQHPNLGGKKINSPFYAAPKGRTIDRLTQFALQKRNNIGDCEFDRRREKLLKLLATTEQLQDQRHNTEKIRTGKKWREPKRVRSASRATSFSRRRHRSKRKSCAIPDQLALPNSQVLFWSSRNIRPI